MEDCQYTPPRGCQLCLHLGMPPNHGLLLGPVAALADLVLCTFIKAIRNVSQSAHTFRHVGLPKASIGKKQATRKGVTKKKSANIHKLCAEVDESSWQPRAALTTTGPHSSQSPPSQFPPPVAFPPQAQAQCSTPSLVQVFTSQQQMSPPAILSQSEILPNTPSTPSSVQVFTSQQQISPPAILSQSEILPNTPSTPSSVQVFTSQQQISPPAILSQPQDLPSTPSQTLQANPCSPRQQVDPFMLTFIRVLAANSATDTQPSPR